MCILRAIYYVAMPESWDKYIVAGLVFGIGGGLGSTLNKCFYSHPSGAVLLLDIFQFSMSYSDKKKKKKTPILYAA